jgi:hypothetical protein
MAGVLILWLVMEAVCQPLQEKRVAIFSDNSPAVGWTKRLASQKSLVAEHFVQALALRIKTNKTCPLTTLHIEGKRNSISNVPSRSFGSTPAWHCTLDKSFLTLFNSLFPLPSQNSWTGFRLNSKVVMRVISKVVMRVIPRFGRSIPIWKGGADYQKSGILLGQLVYVRTTSGSGPIFTDYPFRTTLQVPHGICGTRQIWILW